MHQQEIIFSMKIKKNRVLFISHIGRMGGTSYSLLLLLKFLNSCGDYEFTVLLPEDGELVSHLEKNGINYIIQPLRRRYILKLYFILKRKKINIIYGNNFSNGSWIGLIVSKLLGAKFIWHLREMIDPNIKYAKKRLSRSNELIAVSDSVKRRLEYSFGIKNVNVIHNGIDFTNLKAFKNKMDAQKILKSEFGDMKSTINIVVLSPIVERKNQMFSVKCMEQILSNNNGVKLFLMGNVINDKYHRDIESYISKNNLSDNIHITGFKEISEVLLGFDIMFHPALSDPHPRAVLEAMAACIPVVASNVDGIPETIENGVTGFLFEKESVDSAIEKLTLLIEDRHLRNKIGLNGSEHVKKFFSAKSTANKVHNVISRTVQ